jgi:hypothetical protein
MLEMQEKKKPGPAKNPNLVSATLRVGPEWIKEVGEAVPRRERSAFIRKVVSHHNLSRNAVTIGKGRDRAHSKKIEWWADESELRQFRAAYQSLSAEILRIIVLEAARKKKNG